MFRLVFIQYGYHEYIVICFSNVSTEKNLNHFLMVAHYLLINQSQIAVRCMLIKNYILSKRQSYVVWQASVSNFLYLFVVLVPTYIRIFNITLPLCLIKYE